MVVDQVMFGSPSDKLDDGEDSRQAIRTPLKLAFGCTTKETNMFLSQVPNGIMGLHAHSNRSTREPNIVDNLFDKGAIKSINFSLCLGTHGGYISFGGYNKARHIKGEVVQTVNYGMNSNYRVSISEAKVDGKKRFEVPEFAMEALLDSGTTFTYLPQKVHSRLMHQINDWCRQDSARCAGHTDFSEQFCVTHDNAKYSSERALIESFPPLQFRLGTGAHTATIVWFPRDYINQRRNTFIGETTFCTAIKSTEDSVGLLGGMFMRHYDVLFDREHHQAHFIRAHCDDLEVPGITGRLLQAIIEP